MPPREVNDKGEADDLKVPSWIVRVTFFLGWGLGIAVILLNVLDGDFNLGAFLVGGWLICLPLTASHPFEGLRRVLGR